MSTTQLSRVRPTYDVLRRADIIGRQLFKIRQQVIDSGIRHPHDLDIAGCRPLMIVSHEIGHYLDPYTYPGLWNTWNKWESRLSELFCEPVYFESQNPAITYLWPVRPLS